jgi:hypothetical protein
MREQRRIVAYLDNLRAKVAVLWGRNCDFALTLSLRERDPRARRAFARLNKGLKPRRRRNEEIASPGQ